MLYSLFSKDNNKISIILAVLIFAAIMVCGFLPRDHNLHVNADEQPPTIRYEVKYRNTTFTLYDPIVENPNEPLGSIKERAVEAIKQEFGESLPEGFEKDIKIAAIIESWMY